MSVFDGSTPDAATSDALVDAPLAPDAGDPDGPRAVARRYAHRIIDAVARRQVVPLADGEYGTSSWETVTRNRPPRGIVWLYPWGVTLYGLLRASDASGDRAYADFVLQHNAIVGRYYHYLLEVNRLYGPEHRADVDRMLHAAPVLGAIILGALDNCGSMSSQMLEGTLRHGTAITAEQREIMGSVARYMSMTQSRLPDGAFWRPEQAGTLWIDDLYMSCPFMVRWAEHANDASFLDDAARQIVAFARRQQAPDGLWYHARFVREEYAPPIRWGRANGWAMVATVEVLSALPETHPSRAAVLDVLQRHIAGIVRFQARSGRWRQVPDREELWEETSSTAMFTYSIARAVRRGWIARENLEVAWRGIAGLAENVSTDGSIRETCEGTGIGNDLNYYATRRRPTNDPHGPGPVLLAASEVLLASEGP